jgi:hypothetical protein
MLPQFRRQVDNELAPLPPWRNAPQHQHLPCPQQQQLVVQHLPLQQHRVEVLLNQLQQHSVDESQAYEAEQGLLLLFDSKCDPQAMPTPPRVHALACTLQHDSQPAAAAAARILSRLCSTSTDMISYVLQQDAALSAIARLLQGHGSAAQAASHLLLTLTGQGPDARFEVQSDSPAGLQRVMSSGILHGQVQQFARGSDSAAAAAVPLLARYSMHSGSAAVATQLIQTRAALSSAAALLSKRSCSLALVDAAAQLLHTVAEAGPLGAQAVADTGRAVAGLLSLVITHSWVHVSQHSAQQADDIGTAAGWRAAGALCSIFY